MKKYNIRINFFKHNDTLNIIIKYNGSVNNPYKLDQNTTLLGISISYKNGFAKHTSLINEDYKIPHQQHNKLISMFSNIDVFNTLPPDKHLYCYCDIKRGIPSLPKPKHCMLPLTLPSFSEWKFYDEEYKIYDLVIDKIFLKARQVSFVQVNGRRFLIAADNGPHYREVSIDIANAYDLWEHVNLKKCYMKLAGSYYHIESVGNSLGLNSNYDSFATGGNIVRFTCSNDISVVIPMSMISVYVTEHVFTKKNDVYANYELKYNYD